MGSHKFSGIVGYDKTENSQIASTGAIFAFCLHISQKAAKSRAKLISQSCGELQPAIWLSQGERAI